MLYIVTSCLDWLDHVVGSRYSWEATARPGPTAAGNKTGPAAVARNLEKAITGDDKFNRWRVVTIDQYYTSVALQLQLLAMQVYAVGTIMTNRLGF